jgi:CRP-like cAMP-binding protein
MGSVLTNRLAEFAPITSEERRAVDAAFAHAVTVAPRRRITREGQAQPSVLALVDGFACREKRLGDDRRQILSYVLPGDLLDPAPPPLGRADHAVRALSQCRVASAPGDAAARLLDRPAIALAWWRLAVAEGAVARQWIANLGRRGAYERTAHVLCELFARLERLGLVNGLACAAPLTQVDLGDAVGLSPVHVNRVLQQLRHDGLLDLRGKTLTILDRSALERAALFDPAYLQARRFAAHFR